MDESNDSIAVTVVSHLKNAAMYAAVKKIGNQASLARKLGVSHTEVSRWCNMQSCPPIKPTKSWSQEKIDKLESDLLEITGLLLEDIFPEALRENAAFLNAPKTFERTNYVQSSAMQRLAERYSERTDVQPLKIAASKEISKDIEGALSQLKPRESEIIKRRFGLHGSLPEDLETVAEHFKVTRTRILEIQNRALRKLQGSHILRSHVNDLIPPREQCLAAEVTGE